MYVYMYMYMRVHECAHTYGAHRRTLSVFLPSSPYLVLSPSLNWKVFQLVGWLASEIPGVCPCTVLIPLHTLKPQAHTATPGLLWVLWI